MFGRVRIWSRQHVTLVDAALVAPVLLVCVVGVLSAADTGDPLPVSADLGFTLALLLPLVLRRRFPVGVFAAVAAVAAAQLALGLDLLLADAAVLAAMYTVAAHCRLGRALAALAVVELGVVVVIARSPHTTWRDESDWSALAFYTFLVLLCWVTGRYASVRRGYLAGLEERAESLERERDARAQAAVARERARIARELHDVVAHNVSVMVVQADGAAYAVADDPDLARGAMETVAETGRSALAELRGILGLLREDDHDGDYTPRPGVERLDHLVEQVRRAGLPVEFTVEGQTREVPAGVGLAVYRVVQEALTNTLKHAGPAVGGARVRLRYGADTVEVRVTDDGRGAASARAGDGDGGGDGSGHGLIGMRERVAACGGSVRAGPCAGGGYEVVAALPLRPGEPVDPGEPVRGS
ncbi:histidine kinase [Streptomonospora sp. S1-112]|uniref:histidine kinase n=1 Tax=Streptomonospora mangrovi TaxID=2883123 RepID=A0A9X3NI60_9ACTN|nr:histidine kinase [Streptomonospora mangrovi]MDA0563882.1 histidine kinase [Streptomonospora mangrovi]